MWRRGMVVVVRRKGEQGGTNLCADARTGDISFRGFALRICKGHRWQPEFDLGNRIAREAVGCRGGEFDECNDNINDLGFQMLSDLAGEFRNRQRSPEISRQSHQCPYLPPFAQKSPEPVFTGPERWTTVSHCGIRTSIVDEYAPGQGTYLPLLGSEPSCPEAGGTGLKRYATGRRAANDVMVCLGFENGESSSDRYSHMLYEPYIYAEVFFALQLSAER